jgi:hypothetical protein
MWRYVMMMMAAASFKADAALEITRDGKPQAEIIVSAQADATGKFAAQELQYWVKQISGAELPLLNAATAGDNVKIYLGKEFAGKYETDLAALKDTDGYAVRNDGRNIYIFGGAAKGVLNGVYNFLERNTDIIWARPADFGTVFTPSATIKVSQSDYCDKPVFAIRGWTICCLSQQQYNLPTELWMVHNGCNSLALSSIKEYLPLRVKHGFQIEFGGGHNLNSLYMPANKYFNEHPDFYCQIDGKRRPGSIDNQLCFTNPKMTEAFTGELFEKIKAAPDCVNAFNVMIEDNWNVCECNECTRPIRLPDGTMLDSNDKAFRSTQFFMFLNKVAEETYKQYPDKRINTYGYFFTVAPPKIRIHDIISVRYCPAVKNDKEPVCGPSNQKWKNGIDEWVKASGNITWREYYGCASYFPRPLADVVAPDLCYLSKQGWNKVYAEILPDCGNKYKNKVLANTWDVSAMDFWVITRLYWNPNQNVEQLRKYYLNRTYHQAAPAMERYYAAVRKSWYEDNAPSFYNDSEVVNAEKYILKKGLENFCREALTEAENKAAEPNIRTMVQRHRARFEEWMKEAKAHSSPEITVPYVADAVSGSADINNAVWEKAAQLDDLKVMGNPKQQADPATVIKLMHDRKNLYIALKCIDKDPQNLYMYRSRSLNQSRQRMH